MLKLGRRARGHFVTLIEIRVHLIRVKPGHISGAASNNQEKQSEEDSTINSAFYSVSFFHNSCDITNPCNSSFNRKDSLSALNIYMLLFKGFPESRLFGPLSEMSVSVLFPSLATCALMRPVILGFVTLNSMIRISPCIFLEVKPINLVPGKPG